VLLFVLKDSMVTVLQENVKHVILDVQPAKDQNGLIVKNVKQDFS